MENKSSSVKTTADKIKKAIAKIRPALQADGGNVEFLSWDKKTGTVEVSLSGMCAHCPLAEMTLKQGIEAEIKKQVPGIKQVINVPKI